MSNTANNGLMKAFVLHGKEDLRLERIPIPRTGPEDVRIQITRAGICGSDLHYYQHGKCGAFVPSKPFVLGHEFTGEIVEVGDKVDGLPPGTRVAVDPSQPCRDCVHCRTGRYNLCLNMKYLGTASVVPPRDGAFAEYIVVPARNCIPLDDGFNPGAAAMLEPLSVAAHAVSRCPVVAGKRILITGGGTIGQLVCIMAKAFGAKHICLSDPRLFCRNLSRKSGADEGLDPKDLAAYAADVASFDVVFEASGSPLALSSAINCASRGGTIVQVGTLPNEVALPANAIMAKELQILGSFRFCNVFSLVLDLMKAGRFSVDHLITRVLPFDELKSGFEALGKEDDLLKIQIEAPGPIS